MTRPTRIGRYSGALGAALGGNPGEAPGSPPSPSCCDVGAQPPDRGLTADAFSLSSGGVPELVQYKVGSNSATLDSPPAAGNLLVAFMTGRNDPITVSTADFDEIGRVETEIGNDRNGLMVAKVSNGSDGTIATPNDTHSAHQTILMEWVGAYGNVFAEADDVPSTTAIACGGAIAASAGDVVLGGTTIAAGDEDYPGLTTTPDSGVDEIYDTVNDVSFSPGMWVGYREISSGGSYAASGVLSEAQVYCGVTMLLTGSDAAWNISAPNVTDGDDDTYHVTDGTDLIRMDLGAAYRILSTRIRIATETSGARTLTIKGANVADFSDEVTLGTIAFTATGSYTAQDVTGSWYTATSYRYFELSIDSDEGNRVHAWELYEGTLATNHQHSLINLSDVSGTPQNLDVLAYGSNTGTWQPRSAVLQVTSNGSNALTNPLVNFASGSNITFAVASNTLTIHGAAAGGGGGYTDPLTNRGDLVVRDASATTRLAIGTSGYVLTSDGTDAAWAAASGSSPITTRGDLVVGDSSGDPDRLAIGSSGYVLTSDGTDAAWAASASGFSDPMTTRGDIIVRKSGGTDRLALGTSGYVLTSDGTDIAWAAASGSNTHPTDIRYPVQEIMSGWGNSSSKAGTLPATPTNGNILVAVVLMEGSANVSGIASTNTTWSKLAESTASAAPHVEVWKGVVSASAGTTVTATLSGGSWGGIGVMEFSGLTGTLDQSASRSATAGRYVPYIKPTSANALVVAGSIVTSNGNQYSAITGPHLVNLQDNYKYGIAWGFPGSAGVIGQWVHTTGTMSCVTVSIT